MRAECGTEAAYAYHQRHGETPCNACKQARREGSHRRYQANKNNPKPRPVRPAILDDLPVFDDSAICRQIGPDAFFLEPGEGSNTPGKKACKQCPFLDPCLQYALAWDVYGVWGGTSRSDRKKLRQQAGTTARALSHWGRVINLDGQDGAA